MQNTTQCERGKCRISTCLSAIRCQADQLKSVQGDIWAESRLMGFLWHYYACMEGAVYDVTDWAACQAGNLKHLRANSHSVQYRIVLGQRLPSQTSSSGKKRQQIDPNARYILYIAFYAILSLKLVLLICLSYSIDS